MLAELDCAGGCPFILAACYDWPAIIMSLCNGKTLLDVLHNSPELTFTNWLRIFISVTRSLQEIHDHGLIHCDLALDNVMTDLSMISEGRIDIHIIDFGCSVKLDETP